MRRVLLLIVAAFPLMAADRTPEQRAVDYLAVETPKWWRENQCFSCHNDGDGARALYAAVAQGFKVPADALTRTSEWLARPGQWDSNRGNPASSDKKLARIQFAAALNAAARAGLVRDSGALVAAAALVAEHQEADGSWRVDTGTTAGSPTTYGAILATYLSREALKSAAAERFAQSIDKADAWLKDAKPASAFDAAATLLAVPSRTELVKIVLAAQASNGGWGPFRGAPSEPFDTAVAMLALRGQAGAAQALVRGREYLIRTQLETGGWPETTRPPGGQSYAQHVSTTAWATQALLSNLSVVGQVASEAKPARR